MSFYFYHAIYVCSCFISAYRMLISILDHAGKLLAELKGMLWYAQVKFTAFLLLDLITFHWATFFLY